MNTYTILDSQHILIGEKSCLYDFLAQNHVCITGKPRKIMFVLQISRQAGLKCL